MYDFYISGKLILFISILVTVWFMFLLKLKMLDKTKCKIAFEIYCNFMINLILVYIFQKWFYIRHLLMVISLMFLGANIIIFKRNQILTEKWKIIFIIAVIMIVQFGYVSYTPYYTRQHDSRSFYKYELYGHFGYIGHIFFNNSLPEGSPVGKWCLYNPPLFHLTSAIFLKLQFLFEGISIEAGFENLQVVSYIYMTIFIVYVYRILKEMKIKKSLIYMLAVIGLSPAMIIMSASINNDILSIMLSTMAIFYTIKWYQEDTLKNLIKIALTISLGMMTKVSVALVAVAIACAFLVKVLNNKEKLKKYIGNFAIFALIALPIGLWYPVKNLILYDVPLTYVQEVKNKDTHPANVSNYSVFERLFNISYDNIKNMNLDMEEPNLDYNIFLSTMKSFIVDETIEYEDSMIMKVSIYTAFWSAIAIAIVFLLNVIYVIKKYKEINNHWLSFFAILFLITVAYYIKFCFDFPFVFTMNFRYIVPTFISYAVITGIACDKNEKLFELNRAIIVLFCIASTILFLNLV